MSDTSNNGTQQQELWQSGVGGGPLQALISVLINGIQVLSNLTQAMTKAFTIWNGATATSATSGTASALPTTPAGYATFVNPSTGASVKVPFYNQ